MSRYVQAGHSATSPVSNLHRKTLPLAMYVGANGYVQNGGFVIQPIPELEKRAMQGPRAIRSRCEIEATCDSDELRRIKAMSITAKYNHEKTKNYPLRYPLNEDSVGIEVVARNHGGDYQWDEATAEQRQSIRMLIGFLKNTYFLTDDDVYAHDDISYKTLGEGAGMYDGGAMGGLRRPPPFYDFSGD